MAEAAYAERGPTRGCAMRCSRPFSAQRQRADWATVELCAKQCLLIDPLNERVTLAMAEALAQAGSKDRAVALLDAYRAEVEFVDAAIAVPATLLRRGIPSAPSGQPASAGRTTFVGSGDEIAHVHRDGNGHAWVNLS